MTERLHVAERQGLGAEVAPAPDPARVTDEARGHPGGTGVPDVAGEPQPKPRLATRALIGLVRIYQAARAGRPSPCRFWPSCSAYAVEALETHGAVEGSVSAFVASPGAIPSAGTASTSCPSRGQRRNAVFELFATILAWCYAVTHNYALAIALFTLLVMIVLTPLTLKGTKNMLQLQKLQPEIKRLQAEHKGDRQKLNEEMMALYKENRINPLSGCLPLLLQAPVFFILYRVLRGLTRTCSHVMVIGGQTCKPPNGFYPDYIKQSSALFKSLFGQTTMMSFGIDLAQPATKQLGKGFVNGLPYLILVLVVAGLSYYQQRQVSARMKDQVNPQQVMIMRIIPIFFAVISLTLPAGLIVYFITSSLYRIGQQAYITRRFYRDQGASVGKGGDDSGNGAAKKKPAPKPSPTAAKKPTPKKAPAEGRPAPSSSTGAGKRPTPRGSPNRTTPRPRPQPRPAPKKK